MSFFEKSNGESRFKKTEYLKLTPGTHTVRIIEKVGRKYYQHWLGGGVECLGTLDCPQCRQNRQILDDIGGDYKEAYKEAVKVEGFVTRSARGAVNVLDRTPIKICTKCGTENRPTNNVFLAGCSSCSELITDVAPTVTNNIKVFSRAASVFEQIADLESAVLDEEGNPRGLTNFDLTLHVVGNTTVPVPADNYEEVEFDENDLYDLDTVAIRLSAEEMEKRMKGVSFKEIYQGRRTDVYDDADETSVEVDKEKVAEIESEVEEMFS
jgi:hypothetical protein